MAELNIYSDSLSINHTVAYKHFHDLYLWLITWVACIKTHGVRYILVNSMVLILNANIKHRCQAVNSHVFWLWLLHHSAIEYEISPEGELPYELVLDSQVNAIFKKVAWCNILHAQIIILTIYSRLIGYTTVRSLYPEKHMAV